MTTVRTQMQPPRLVPPARTISAIYVRAIVEILDDLGMPEARSSDVLGTPLGALDNPRLRLREAELCKLLAAAEDETGNVMIGLEAGFRFRVANFTKTGAVLAYCRTLREAGAVNARYAPLAETIGLSEYAVTSTTEGERHALRWTPEGPDFALRHVTELVLGGYATTVAWLGWAMEWRIPYVGLRHARPDPTPDMSREDIDAVYQRVFQCRPAFRAEHNEVALPMGAVDVELPTYSPTQLERQRQRLDAVMYGRGDQRAEVLRGLLREGLSDGLTTRAGLASASGLSLRELDRQLSSEGLTFRSLLDDVRRDGFDRLSARGIGLAEIAADLGFNDQAALTRAFRRWYGTTPGRHLAGPWNIRS